MVFNPFAMIITEYRYHHELVYLFPHISKAPLPITSPLRLPCCRFLDIWLHQYKACVFVASKIGIIEKFRQYHWPAREEQAGSVAITTAIQDVPFYTNVEE